MLLQNKFISVFVYYFPFSLLLLSFSFIYLQTNKFTKENTIINNKSSFSNLNKQHDWNSYWNDEETKSPEAFKWEKQMQRQVLENRDYYIKYSYFSSLQNSNGGAIFLSTENSTTKLLIESSSFINCSVPEYGRGGAIYMDYGNCILSKNCGYQCSSYNNHGPFSYININDINKIFDTSVTQCTSYFGYTLCHMYGEIIIQSLNSSFNICAVCSSLYCFPTRNGCNISYSSITNCTTSTYYVIFIELAYILNHIQYSNILYNKQPSTIVHAIITTDSTTTLNHDSILGNEGSPIFSSPQFTLIDCTIGEDQIQSDKLSVNRFDTNSLTPTQSFLNLLSFINTGSCINFYDKHLTLKFIPQARRWLYI